ncbi:hypothetical protein AAC387_Pa07g3751 [Persea americana]
MGRMVVAAIVSIWVIPMSILVNRIVPDPYMDEIFHIPQAQQYCRGDFKSWDPMITTPPGLYYLSLAYVASLFPVIRFTNASLSFSESCSTPVLRSTNDVASLTAVLAMYLACLKQHYWLSALLGGLAIFIRQTNVVWMLFVACIGAINYKSVLNGKDHIQPDHPMTSSGKIDRLADKKRPEVAPNLRHRKMSNSVNTINLSSIKMTVHSSSPDAGMIGEVQDIIAGLWSLKWEFLMSFTPYILVLVAFIAFVIWNGSVVLGAKEAHAVSPHFAQIMYFGLVSAAAMAPMHFSFGQISVLCQLFWKNKLLNLFLGLIALTVGLIAVHFFSVAHPYLLADNRHYPFYMWRKVITAHWSMKYLLVPLYVYSWFSIFSILGKFRKKIWVLIYFLACAAVLIPAPLIEFRYYTIPFYFMILHSQIDDNRSWSLIGILYMAVNIFTMMMFLFRPFTWAHEPGTQRFIW